ncbi:probable vacuolar amino acid transporter YPQ1 isoform X2 [Benincasa hispida]|uniref:probable vacuolar amino acid transporter YPQ1 isoform X2 n=1 Tax=Benincasa hispida TaxID=102211 RepID=UPI001900CD1B|nr:probable vacuolar amino acid transporter YPQ1 isoform X2 [Benincasa hispida]
MGLFQSSKSICPSNKHCSEWVKKNMKYCLCNAKDGVSLTLGMISVISWGVAEIPQIITNYREKSSEGLSLAFLLTWILGDLFNVFGCILEPATLPTQYYMALLYTITTGILLTQTLYYGHIYPQMKYRRRQCKGLVQSDANAQIDAHDKVQQSYGSVNVKINNDDDMSNFNTSRRERASTNPIPLPMLRQNSSMGRELYYMSARSLSRSHTPTAGSFLTQKMTPPHTQNPMQEPLLDGNEPSPSATPPNVKNMLCVVSMLTFVGTLNHHQSAESRFHRVSDNPKKGFVIPVGRKLLQVAGDLLQNNGNEGSSGIGTYLGWAMAIIYMGGRLPQICLNIRRGHVEGLSPLMFIFALIGNSTYVASILVSSTSWSKIKPNLPWLVDAFGCVLLDTFILIQFIYYHYRIQQDEEDKLLSPNET